MSGRSLTTIKSLAVLSGLVLLLQLTLVGAGSFLLPELAPAKPGATQCVEPTDVMRKEHYTFLNHQRDKTVHDGVRKKQHSLVECIACHIQPREDGSIPKHTEADHFCSTCHKYVAVKIDCFQCHADKDPAVGGHGSKQVLMGNQP